MRDRVKWGERRSDRRVDMCMIAEGWKGDPELSNIVFLYSTSASPPYFAGFRAMCHWIQGPDRRCVNLPELESDESSS